MVTFDDLRRSEPFRIIGYLTTSHTISLSRTGDVTVGRFHRTDELE